MAVGAHVMARLLVRQRWIGVVGLAIILFVSYQLLRDGSIEIIGILGQQTN
jgi:predicted tellurium resistance membrane protein TerC